MTIKPLRRPMHLIAAAALGVFGIVVLRTPLYGAPSDALIAPPALDNPKAAGAPQIAVLAGGCFWGVQGVFEHVRGVQKAVAGYAGGDKATAHYGTVGYGTTGHTESVSITFDPAQVSYGQILQIAFSVVFDPTQLNRQGPDPGSQYRSVIFYADITQKRIAEVYIGQLETSRTFARPIVTQVDALKGFYPAEDYHQDFLVHNPTNSYIVFNDLPKIENFKHTFPDLYRERPVLVGAN
jgi:peptide-methionine (S)-S-oxide reductase